MSGLFDDQMKTDDEASWPVVEGIKLMPLHVEGFKVLRRVLPTLSVAECKTHIEQYDTIETILAQSAVGQLLPMSFGTIVRLNWKELAKS